MKIHVLMALTAAVLTVANLSTAAAQNDGPVLITDAPTDGAPAIPVSDEMTDELARIATIRNLDRAAAGAGKRIYLPGTYAVAQALPTDLVSREPNNSTCQAIGPLASSVTYQAAFESNDVDDWFFYDAKAGVNLKLKGSNIPTPNQFQVFFADGSNCAAVPTTPAAKVDDKSAPELSLAPQSNGRLFVRVVGVRGTTGGGKFTLRVETNNTSGVFEDNDTPCQATPTLPGTTYTTNADDTYDFFELKVTSPGQVKINVAGFPAPSQLQLRSPIKSGCDAVTSTDRVGEPGVIVNGAAAVSAFVQPGTYYARMGPPNGALNGAAYTFNWTFTPGSADLRTDTCAAFVDCFGNAAGGKFTLLWRNMPSGAKASVQLVSELVRNCPKTTQGEGTYVFDPTAGSASREFTGLGRGFFKAKVTIRNSAGAQIYYNEHPLKMDCDFAAANASMDADATPDVAPTPAP